MSPPDFMIIAHLYPRANTVTQALVHRLHGEGFLAYLHNRPSQRL